MRSKKNVETLKMQKGEYHEKEFDNYLDMATHAVDWTLFCTYQLQPSFSEGIYKILQLPSMQIAYTVMSGGIMFDYVAPEGTITFSVMHRISHKASLDQMKLETGMIAVVDDSKIYNFICSEGVEIYDISLNEEADPKLRSLLCDAVDRYYLDSDGQIGELLEVIIERWGEKSTALDESDSHEIEATITDAMLRLLETQKPGTPRFTSSEKRALAVKQRLFRHMDHTMSVASLAQEYKISERSLQNAFHSLFGIQPNRFIRLLKLNHVRHELMQGDSSRTSVTRVARKWGFTHMGRFTHYYTELFGENPSFTLKTVNPIIDGMHIRCVERREEME
jgi:AraC-like DNA-binding protein